MFEIEPCEPDESLPDLCYRVVDKILAFTVGVFDDDNSTFTPMSFKRRDAIRLCKTLNTYVDQALAARKRKGVSN